jgi:vitamin B12/bleomycin/antimicrobial peptide transport system ATP-binding/permease protein
MDSPEFTPSVDWGNELVNSTLWVLEAFLITALCLVVVLFLLRRCTGWGRQFGRITGDYFTGRASWQVWLMLSTVAAVRFLLDLYLAQRFVVRWRVWLTAG